VGFSVGGGVEYAFTQHLLGRVQYIYDDFGSKDYVATDGGTYRVNLTSQTVRGALAWKFQIWSSAAENPRTFQSRDWLTNG
jgi:outer membrane immunogenic protein